MLYFTAVWLCLLCHDNIDNMIWAVLNGDFYFLVEYRYLLFSGQLQIQILS